MHSLDPWDELIKWKWHIHLGILSFVGQFFGGARNILATTYTPMLSELPDMTHSLTYRLLIAEMLEVSHNRIRFMVN